MKLFFLFLDGFGIGDQNPYTNPMVSADLPALRYLCGGDLLFTGSEVTEGEHSVAIPADARLGVEGIPQSATGQAALLTGYNAPQIVGRHVNAFPTGILKKLIVEKSIFTRVLACGKKATFINAFREDSLSRIQRGTYKMSASSAAVLGAGLSVRPASWIKLRQAIYHDITGDILRQFGYDVPKLSAVEAGEIAAEISFNYDFSMFEFFLTDRAGHSQDMKTAIEVLERVDCFVSAVLKKLDLGSQALLITSDHGNIEDLSVPTHTLNRVPVILYGLTRRERLDMAARIRTIMDVNAVMTHLVCGQYRYYYGGDDLDG
ncbi:MAG TPA: hypothetical protein GXX40_10240 [Firmicutes bacterium]|nr:hypothetical protein [Bacillota bacterium]